MNYLTTQLDSIWPAQPDCPLIKAAEQAQDGLDPVHELHLIRDALSAQINDADPPPNASGH